MRANTFHRIDSANRFVIIGESEKQETIFFDKIKNVLIYSPYSYNLIRTLKK